MQLSRLQLLFVIAAGPDFHQVYSFIGNLFDPSASASASPSEHLKTLKKMDPITVKTVSQFYLKFMSFPVEWCHITIYPIKKLKYVVFLVCW